MAVNHCNCSFCSSLAGNTSFFTDSPEAFSEVSGLGDFGTALSPVDSTPIILFGASWTAPTTNIGWARGVDRSKSNATQFTDLRAIAANMNYQIVRAGVVNECNY